MDKNTRFEEIYKEYFKPMFLYAISFLTAEEEAENVVQEIFMNLWKAGNFQNIHIPSLKTYLFRSVRNACLNRLKKKNIASERLEMIREEVILDEAERLNDDLISEIEAEIESLPTQTREVIRGVYFHNLKYQEIADRLNVSLNTVKSLQRYGMQHLRERFADRLDLFLMMILLR